MDSFTSYTFAFDINIKMKAHIIAPVVTTTMHNITTKYNCTANRQFHSVIIMTKKQRTTAL